MKNTDYLRTEFLSLYRTTEKHKVLPEKEPYVLQSLVPINILINRQPEHNQESSGSGRDECTEKKKKRSRKSQATMEQIQWPCGDSKTYSWRQ